MHAVLFSNNIAVSEISGNDQYNFNEYSTSISEYYKKFNAQRQNRKLIFFYILHKCYC